MKYPVNGVCAIAYVVKNSVEIAEQFDSMIETCARDIAEAERNLVGAKAIGYWMDAIAVAFEYDSRLKKQGEYGRAWRSLAEWLKNDRRIQAIDIGEINRERFPVERKLLRYIDQQMSRMNYEHAAACMINWLPELEKMTGYVSRETSLTFKCARVK